VQTHKIAAIAIILTSERRKQAVPKGIGQTSVRLLDAGLRKNEHLVFEMEPSQNEQEH
jgi:hypothetical protein